MNQVLPLLDGLDEVASEARLACAHAILDYQQNRERNSLVVCCRSTEYQDLALPFPFNRAVSLLPLAEEQIETYLSSIPEQLDGLRQALQDDPEIAREASLPLMLNIFTQAYRGETSKPLVVDAHHKTIRPVVFAHYVQRMLTRRKQLLSWRQEDMCHWLTFIARVLQKRQRDDFEVGDLLRPDWLSASQQRLYRWSIRLFYGLLLGTTFGVSFGVVSGLLTGLIVGLLIGLLNLLQKPYQSNLKPYQSNPEPQTIVRGYLVLGPLVGLFFGCIYGLIVGWSFGLFLALIMGLCCSLMGIVPLFILRFWLWYTNCLPWRLVPFLDEAVARLLLYSYRPWGPHDFRHDQFWFRHQFLLEYFATLDNPASPETVSSEGEA